MIAVSVRCPLCCRRMAGQHEIVAGQRTIWHNAPIGVGGEEEAEDGQHHEHQHNLGHHHEHYEARVVMQPMGRHSQQPRA